VLVSYRSDLAEVARVSCEMDQVRFTQVLIFVPFADKWKSRNTLVLTFFVPRLVLGVDTKGKGVVNLNIPVISFHPGTRKSKLISHQYKLLLTTTPHFSMTLIGRGITVTTPLICL
jgi:hypothetical protein